MWEFLKQLREFAASLNLDFAEVVRLIADLSKAIKSIMAYPGLEDEEAWKKWATQLSGAMTDLAVETDFTQVDDTLADVMAQVVADETALDSLYGVLEQLLGGDVQPTAEGLTGNPHVQAISDKLGVAWETVVQLILWIYTLISNLF